MADINGFFGDYLPGKLVANPTLASGIGAIFQFDIDGAGTWVVDLTDGSGSVYEGRHETPGCVVSTSAENFDKLLENPNAGMTLFMTGKLKVSDIPLGMRLQQLLS